MANNWERTEDTSICQLQQALATPNSQKRDEMYISASLQAMRLKRLQKLGGMYSQVELSPHVQAILDENSVPSTITNGIIEIPAEPARANGVMCES